MSRSERVADPDPLFDPAALRISVPPARGAQSASSSRSHSPKNASVARSFEAARANATCPPPARRKAPPQETRGRSPRSFEAARANATCPPPPDAKPHPKKREGEARGVSRRHERMRRARPRPTQSPTPRNARAKPEEFRGGTSECDVPAPPDAKPHPKKREGEARGVSRRHERMRGARPRPTQSPTPRNARAKPEEFRGGTSECDVPAPARRKAPPQETRGRSPRSFEAARANATCPPPPDAKPQTKKREGEARGVSRRPQHRRERPASSERSRTVE